MTRRARNRFVAWLGIAAMWLAIVAPVISQSVAAHRAASDPQTLLCAVDALADSASDTDADEHAHHHEHGGDAQALAASEEPAHAGHHDAAGHFEACSYCGLLAHHLPIATAPVSGVVRIERSVRVESQAEIAFVCAKSFNAACPRAPPVLS